jgi:hypothetical protein
MPVVFDEVTAEVAPEQRDGRETAEPPPPPAPEMDAAQMRRLLRHVQRRRARVVAD